MRTIFRITAYSWRRRWLFAITALIYALSSLPHVAIPRLLGAAIDHALSAGAQRELLLVGGTILLVGAIRLGFVYSSIYLGEVVGQWVSYDLRREYFHKLQRLSAGFYDRRQTGDLMSRATVDVEAVGDYTAYGFMGSFSGIVIFLTAPAILLFIDWRLGLIVFAFIPVIVWISIRMTATMSPLFAKALGETGRMNAVAQENLAGIRLVKAFGGRDHEARKFEERALSVADNYRRAGHVEVSWEAVVPLVFAAATAAILYFGGREVFADRLTPGELASFILYMGVLGFSVFALGWRVQLMARALAASRRIFEVLDFDPPFKESPSARVLERVQGRVRFDHVSLSYRESDEALRGVDFEVLPGQMVALLGGPGSGKSTIVHLLPRFYEATAGSVSIDGVDIRDVTLESLRRNIGIVLQDSYAFSATIRDNIAYGADGASLEDVVRAARVAQLHDFVEGLPNGYDTWVGERGITLSGGQRQRLAIARTVLMDPAILVLDDSTSSVDVGTEALIQQALADVIKGRTTFVIAHRLSTVRNADLILVLDRGRIVERGAHDELLAAGGHYRRIHDLQLKPQEEIRLIADRPFAEGGPQ